MVFGKHLAAYLAAGLSFIALDAIWLRTMLPRLYAPVIGGLMRPKPRLWPAAAFYVGYPLGLLVFAVFLALQEGGAAKALFNGSIFGLFTYATYDLTNHATLKHWSTVLSMTDISWGSALGASSAFIGYLTTHHLFGT